MLGLFLRTNRPKEIKMAMFRIPSTCGWRVEWFTGEEKVITRKNGSQKVIRFADSFKSRSKAEVEAKAEELRRQGFEPSEITECIW